MPDYTLPTVNHLLAQGAERRRHARAKITFRVHVRGGVGTQGVFEDFGKSVDVTRDGILLSTSRGGYRVDRLLYVTCPYWGAPSAVDAANKARVIRSSILPGTDATRLRNLGIRSLVGLQEMKPIHQMVL